MGNQGNVKHKSRQHKQYRNFNFTEDVYMRLLFTPLFFSVFSISPVYSTGLPVTGEKHNMEIQGTPNLNVCRRVPECIATLLDTLLEKGMLHATPDVTSDKATFLASLMGNTLFANNKHISV